MIKIKISDYFKKPNGEYLCEKRYFNSFSETNNDFKKFKFKNLQFGLELSVCVDLMLLTANVKITLAFLEQQYQPQRQKNIIRQCFLGIRPIEMPVEQWPRQLKNALENTTKDNLQPNKYLNLIVF